jgi:hypothetical protein
MNDNQAQQTQDTQDETAKQPAVTVTQAAQPEPVKEFASKVEHLMYHADAQGQLAAPEHKHFWEDCTRYLGGLWEKARRHA